MKASLAPYLPRVAAEWELDLPGAGCRELTGTCCFVDISGFTALSERLARHGRIGAEELTEVLDHVFAEMLAVAYAKGGSLLKFGGDALLLLFSGPEHPKLACEAAVAMRAALREARRLPTSVGRVNLRMSVGIHSGEFQLFRVGSSHKELLIAGPDATETTRMEQVADAGEIVVSAATAASLPPRAVGDAKGAGFKLRWRRAPAAGPGPMPVRSVANDELALAVPVGLRDHLRSGSGESEHRLATVGFVKFVGVDDHLLAHGLTATARALEEIVRAVQEAADREDVTFLASDIDANGGKIILVAGVPTAREDDEGRLLRCLRDVLDHEFQLGVKAGAHRGHVFAGDVGAEFRRTFTIMGDTVNLAARLMAAAPLGEIYATADVLDRSRTAFHVAALEPFFVKGKAQPVQAYRLGRALGVQASDARALPFVGRDAELAQLAAAYDAACSASGAVVVVEADRGSGKTRLLEELAAAVAVSPLRIQGEAYATATGYGAVRAGLGDAFGLDRDDRALAGKQLVQLVRETAGAHIGLAPLLGVVLGVEVASTPESDAVAAEFRADRAADLLIEILAGRDAPVVVLVDDAQWIDGSSAAFLERLANAASEHAWLMVVARRPGDGGFLPVQADATMRLPPLDDTIASALVDRVTEASPLRPQVRDAIVARAAGSPLFIEELLRHGAASGFADLPETLDAVATREIDALPPSARRVLRYASVLGREFEPALLADLLDPYPLGPADLDAVSAHLLPGARLRFRHALLQEAAYANLPFRKRTELHARAARAIERRPGPDPASDGALLSLHFFLAQDWPRAYTAARQAGLHAADVLAHDEAATHLERALRAVRHVSAPAEEIAHLWLELGEARVTLGLHDGADDAYRHAMALSEDRSFRALVLDRRAYVRGECQGRVTAAVRHVRAGLALVDDATDARAREAHVQLVAREASLRLIQGRLRDAERLARVTIEEARAIGEQLSAAKAMTVLDVALIELGRADEAVHMIEALQIYETLGDHLRTAVTLNNLGGVDILCGRWIRAGEHLERSAEAARRAGDVSAAALAECNLGELRANQLRLTEAEPLLADGIRTLEACELVVNAAQARVQLGRVRALLGDEAQGFAMLDAALRVFDEGHLSLLAVETRIHRAELIALAGTYAAAADAVAEARALAAELGDGPHVAGIARVAALVAVLADEPGASTAVEAALEQAHLYATRYDELVLAELVEVTGPVDGCTDYATLATELGAAGRLLDVPLYRYRKITSPRPSQSSTM